MNIYENDTLVASLLLSAKDYLEDRNRGSFLDLRNNFSLAAHELEGYKKPNPHLLEAVLEHTSTICLASRDFEEELPLTVSHSVLDILMSGRNLANYLKKSNSEEALAWFSCSHAITYGFSGVGQKFIKLLNKWTKQSLDIDTPIRLDSVVTLLYGPACWQLYGCVLSKDTDSDAVFKTYNDISKAGLPLVFKNKQALLKDISAALPDNIGLD